MCTWEMNEVNPKAPWVNVLRVSQHGHPTVSSRFWTSLQSSQSALLQGDGLGRVLAFLGSTLAGEILAFNVPKSVSIVEPNDTDKAS